MLFTSIFRRTSGQSLIEYGLLGILTVGLVAAIFNTSTWVQTRYNSVVEMLPGSGGGAPDDGGDNGGGGNPGNGNPGNDAPVGSPGTGTPGGGNGGNGNGGAR